MMYTSTPRSGKRIIPDYKDGVKSLSLHVYLGKELPQSKSISIFKFTFYRSCNYFHDHGCTFRIFSFY